MVPSCSEPLRKAIRPAITKSLGRNRQQLEEIFSPSKNKVGDPVVQRPKEEAPVGKQSSTWNRDARERERQILRAGLVPGLLDNAGYREAE